MMNERNPARPTVSEPLTLRDDNGQPVIIGPTQDGKLGINARDGMASILIVLSGERLSAFRDAIGRAAVLDPATRPAPDDEIVMPGCNYDVVDDTRGRMVDVGADVGEVELGMYKLALPAARELLAGLAASINHCEWWLAENGQPLTVAAVTPALAETMGEIADAAQEVPPCPAP